MVTLTLNRSGVSHSVHSATAAAAGGLNIARTQGFHIQINGGSFFTFLDNSGIRSTTTAAGGNGTLRIQGTQANPVVSYRNGWMLDSASTGRNEGAQLGLGVNANPVIVDYFYAIQNYQEGIEVNGGTSATLRNVISAENQNALESGGTAPNVATAANLFVQSASTLVRLQDSVLFNNVGQTANDNAFRWNPAAGASLSTIRTIICGTGDQGNCAAGGLTWTDVDTAVVTAGPHAMEATPLILNATSRTNTQSISADPDFENTTFSATYTVGTGITVPLTYMSVRSTAYRASRASGAENVRGANPASPLPVALSAYTVE